MIGAPSPFSVALMLVLAAGCLAPDQAQAQAGVIVVDSFNRKVHLASAAKSRRPVGGLAKIATAMVVLDWAEASKVGVNVLATVPPQALSLARHNRLGLQPGDKVTLRDLIYATMMGGDDLAAITLGYFVGYDHLYRLGRQGDPLSEFVRQMNHLARREGAFATRFLSPHGSELSRSVSVSTAADMARLALYAVSRPAMHFYTNQRSRDITVFRAGQAMQVAVVNGNPLLGGAGVDGIKVAGDDRSGDCAAISAERPASVYKQADGSSLIYRHRMVVIVLGSSDARSEAQNLLAQGWNTYTGWLAAGRPIAAQSELLNFY